MTEQEWLECTDPTPMLEFLRGKASDRKLRLFAAACCRRIWPLLDREGRIAVDTTEHYVDGQADEAALWIACRATDPFRSADNPVTAAGRNAPYFTAMPTMPDVRDIDPGHPVEAVVTHAAHAACLYADLWGETCDAVSKTDRQTEAAAQASLLREILNNPFRPLTISHRLLTPEVVKEAQAIYSDRAFDLLPILADALEDAGCTNADILNHCRRPGEHVRGCWVVDLILSKDR